MLGDISYHKATLQSKGKHSIHYSIQSVSSMSKLASENSRLPSLPARVAGYIDVLYVFFAMGRLFSGRMAF